MDLKIASTLVVAALAEGAELRMKIGREIGPTIVKAAELIANCLQSGNKLLLFENGGSAADAQHLAAEFVGRFAMERVGLPAIGLTTDSSILTAVGNDYGFVQIFSRQIEALGRINGVAIRISTSGNSSNVLAALKQAAKQNLKTIGLAGKDGGAVAKCVDLPITVEVRHLAVPFLINEHVCSVAELVTAVAGATFAANSEVVRGRPESRTNPHSLGVHTMVIEVFDHQLELVEQGLAEDDVLRPDTFLVVRDEVPEPEMLGHPRVFVLGCHFNEAIRVLVGFRPESALFLWPVTQPVAVQPGAHLLSE